MTSTRLLSSSLLAGLFAMAACGSNSIPLSNLNDEVNHRMCKNQVDCGAYPDMATCLAAQDANGGGFDQLQESVNAGRIHYDGDKASQCLDDLTSQLSCQSLTDYGMYGTPDACNETFTGTVAAGGECYQDQECADNGTCNTSCGADQCCAGTCVAGDAAPAKAELGQDCSNTDCVDGLWCKTDSANNTQTCAELGGEGADCDGLSGCGAGLACDGIYQAGKCVRPAQPGETCDPQQGYGLLSCIRDDNYCDTTTMKCTQKIDVGQACDSQQNNCVDYAYCDATSNMCVQRPAENDACTTDGPSCLGDLDCTNNVCAFPAPTPLCPAM